MPAGVLFVGDSVLMALDEALLVALGRLGFTTAAVLRQDSLPAEPYPQATAEVASRAPAVVASKIGSSPASWLASGDLDELLARGPWQVVVILLGENATWAAESESKTERLAAQVSEMAGRCLRHRAWPIFVPTFFREQRELRAALAAVPNVTWLDVLESPSHEMGEDLRRRNAERLARCVGPLLGAPHALVVGGAVEVVGLLTGALIAGL